MSCSISAPNSEKTVNELLDLGSHASAPKAQREPTKPRWRRRLDSPLGAAGSGEDLVQHMLRVRQPCPARGHERKLRSGGPLECGNSQLNTRMQLKELRDLLDAQRPIFSDDRARCTGVKAQSRLSAFDGRCWWENSVRWPFAIGPELPFASSEVFRGYPASQCAPYC